MLRFSVLMRCAWLPLLSNASSRPHGHLGVDYGSSSTTKAAVIAVPTTKPNKSLSEYIAAAVPAGDGTEIPKLLNSLCFQECRVQVYCVVKYL